jgi:hypothetical protein
VNLLVDRSSEVRSAHIIGKLPATPPSSRFPDTPSLSVDQKEEGDRDGAGVGLGEIHVGGVVPIRTVILLRRWQLP